MDENLAALIISGLPTMEQLAAAWQNIAVEYADAMGTAEHKAYTAAIKDIARQKYKIKVIDDMVELLGVVYYQPFADRLNALSGSNFQNYEDRVKYMEELKRAHRRKSGLIIRLDLTEIRFAELIKKFTSNLEGKKTTREYYQSWLINLSDFAKYPINDQITVFEFCTRINRYQAAVESSKNKK